MLATIRAAPIAMSGQHMIPTIEQMVPVLESAIETSYRRIDR
jgi:hypothetical protein